MGTKMKGIFKGFKQFSQIFVYKEHEMEIGCPTDVRHVAHIGWDGTSAAAPSWMNEFKTGPEFSAPSMSSLTQSRDPNSITIEEIQQSMGLPTGDEFQTEAPEVRKKTKRKKNKASSLSSSRSSRREAKPKASFSTAAENQVEGMENRIAVS